MYSLTTFFSDILIHRVISYKRKQQRDKKIISQGKLL